MTFLYLVPTGINDPNEPSWGSWAGRYGPNSERPGKAYYWANQMDVWNGATNRDNTLARWAVDLQNDFRARLDWCVRAPTNSNHRPVAVVNGDRTARFLLLAARTGEVISLSAAGSTDPDGDEVTCEWFVYPEAGTCRRCPSLSAATGMVTSFVAPAVDEVETIHVILIVRDDGEPRLSGYRRAVITVKR